VKTGYSNFLGEHVLAEQLGYEDCRDFQIVCPCCREPIFKVTREVAERPIHFLSHYQASRTDVTDCERRVGSITREHREQQDATGRGQRMDLFLSVMAEEVEALSDDPRVGELRKRLLASKAFTIDFVGIIREKMRRILPMTGDKEAPLWNLGVNNPVVRRLELSDFTKAIRVRTARDMMRTLYSNKGKMAFVHLAAHVVAEDWARPIEDQLPGLDPRIVPQHIEAETQNRELLDILCTESRSAGQYILGQAAKMQAAIGNASVLGYLETGIVTDVPTALLRIDYVDILQRRLRDGRLDLQRDEIEAAAPTGPAP